MQHWSTIVERRELPFGWGFFWDVDEYLRTRDIQYALGGNGPLIVLRATGALYGLGTATSFEAQCAAFERNLLPRILC